MMNEFVGYGKWLFLEQIDGVYFSDLALILTLSAAITFIPGYVLIVKGKTTFKRVLLVFVTLAYAGVILLLTIFRRSRGVDNRIIHAYIDLGFTRHGIYSYMQTIYSAFNFLLFFFWGIIIGLYRKTQGPLRIIFMTTLTGFITSFTIEFLQLLTGKGNFELTDLLTNVTGSLCGAIVVALIIMISRGITKNE